MSKSKSRRRTIRRRILLEQMEMRLPLAVDIGHNLAMPADVNDDQMVTSRDALAIINHLRRTQLAEAESVDASISDMYYDVNNDGLASAADALQVINQLGRESEDTGIDRPSIDDGQSEVGSDGHSDGGSDGGSELEPVHELEVLGPVECWQLLRSTDVGRLAVAIRVRCGPSTVHQPLQPRG